MRRLEGGDFVIGISNYEGLCNRERDHAKYILDRGNQGFEFTRNFLDLPWWTTPSDMVPAKSLFLYQYNAQTKRYLAGKLNQEFVDKLNACGRSAKLSGMQGITLCLATDPSYYKDSIHKSYPWQIGYRNAEDLFHRGDFDADKWEQYLNWCSDLAEVCKAAPNPFMFNWFETANELKQWGSILDECKGIRGAIKPIKIQAKFQINPPLEELHENDDFRWFNKLLAGVGGFKADRVSFHGFFTAAEIAKEATYLRNNGIDLARIVFETDGATPNGTFTRQSHSGHYVWRPTWTKTPAKTKAVIDCHVAMIKEAKKQGVNFNIQDPIKWSLMKETPQLKKFYDACSKAIVA